MPSFYFDPKPSSEHDEREIAFDLGDIELRFTTDSGVFSRDRVDPGSELLISNVSGSWSNALDLGCGVGAIGITLARLMPDTRWLLSDVNERAVELCRRNIDRNRVANAKAVLSDSFQNITGSFDLIVSNPPIRTGKQTIYPMWSECFSHLDTGGAFVIVIRKKQGAPSAKEYLTELFGNCETIARAGGYHILRSVKQA